MPDVPLTRPSSSRLRRRDVVLAVSLAHLCLCTTWFELFHHADHDYYNRIPVNAPSLLAFGFLLAMLALAFWAAQQVVRGSSNPWMRRAGDLLFLALLLIPLNFLRKHVLAVASVGLIRGLTSVVGIALVLVAAAVVVRWHRRAARMGAVAVVILSPLTLFTLAGVAGSALQLARGAEPGPPPRAPLLPVSPDQPRVVWIIFDELDQRLAFAERPPGLAMPELDRFRASALYASEAFPPARATLLSLPSLLLGESVRTAWPSSRDELSLSLTHGGETVPWSARDNVFSRARARGLNTALVGWYHPYSRLFGAILNACAWYPYPPFEQARGESFVEAVVNQLWAIATPLQQRRLQVQLYQRSLASSIDVVTNGVFGLTLLHLPVPHTPGIYRPARERFTITTFSLSRGYRDNLALTDRTLGILRRHMESAGLWDRTWVLISSDHWWRDAGVYDGRMERRIPFLLKAPGGDGGPLLYPRPFNTALTPNLLLALLQCEVTNLASARAWLDAHHVEPPTDYGTGPDH